MSPVERNWHEDFIKYTEFIAGHPNYEGVPEAYKQDGTVEWIVFGKSQLGQERFDWWDRKREELDIPRVGHWRSKTARANHPTKLKPCQVCGRVLSVEYLYPNRTTVRKINEIIEPEPELVYSDFLEITEIIEILADSLDPEDTMAGLAEVFKIPRKIPRSVEAYNSFIIEHCRSRLSPGAMSNCPDRFDGFHTYNICCRSTHDTGRHAENLARYGEDRRAYEYWTDGDWKAAGWLMKRIDAIDDGVCDICGRIGKVTADHLGPISLGFSVGDPPVLRPACQPCNSSRNNRMTLKDIEELIELEKSGTQVASWHTRYVWEKLKQLPNDNKEGKRVSRLMRTNLHYVLTMLALIAEAGHEDFLVERFLHPEYAHYSIEFEGFDPITAKYDRMVKTGGDRTEYERNAQRYVRIALESLKSYLDKENRKFPKRRMGDVTGFAKDVIDFLDSNQEREAAELIDKALRTFAEWAVSGYVSRKKKQTRLSSFV